MHDVRFKPAVTEDELEQIHRLNHETFAQELGQYEINPRGVLVDRYHELNRYFIAKRGDEVIGMISINSAPPFSIEKRLSDRSVLDRLLAPSEIRMLAVRKDVRNSLVAGGLFWQVFVEARRLGRTHMLISGITERASMYHSLGFRSLGEAVPSGDVSYIPMMMSLDDSEIHVKAERFRCWWERRRSESISLIPGPVAISKGVRRAFQRSPLSHRCAEMVEAYEEVRASLSRLANGMQVALMTGSGTLANDAVAACLRARFGEKKGLVLANGEFGERLLQQASAAGLVFDSLRWEWTEAWDLNAIAARLKTVAWVWCVHLETSTGRLNSLQRLSNVCRAHGVALAADCVSSLGATPIDGCSLSLASGVSGKAIGGYAGIAMVFTDQETLAAGNFASVPATFDLRRNVAQREPMYTIASPQLLALRQALRENYKGKDACSKRFLHYCQLGAWLRSTLHQHGIAPLVMDESAAPVIVTFKLRGAEAQRCLEAGYCISYESSYLAERGWGQISVMGDLTAELIAGVFAALGGMPTAQPFS